MKKTTMTFSPNETWLIHWHMISIISHSFQHSYHGSYFCRTARATVPILETDSDLVVFTPRECTNLSFLSHFTYTLSEELCFVDDHFCEDDRMTCSVSTTGSDGWRRYCMPVIFISWHQVSHSYRPQASVKYCAGIGYCRSRHFG